MGGNGGSLTCMSSGSNSNNNSNNNSITLNIIDSNNNCSTN